LALTPVPYDTIRRQLALEGAFPFVNSAYGDNHERAVMTPISRTEFVTAATARGIKQEVAYKIFSLAGGPDVVHSALISAAAVGHERLIERSVDVIGDRLDGFFKDSFGELGTSEDDLFGRLALGRLLPHEEDYIESHLLSRFVAQRSKAGALVSASPILSRLFLRRRRGTFAVYDEILDAIRVGNYKGAVELVSSTESDLDHLKMFRCLVEMLAALNVNDDRNLLNIGWDRILGPAQKIAASPNAPDHIREWASRMLDWARFVTQYGVPANDNRLRLDALTVRCGDKSRTNLYFFQCFAI